MKIENGIVYFDPLEQMTFGGLVFGAITIATMIAIVTIIVLAWWSTGYNLQVPLGYALRGGMSLAIVSLAVAFIGIIWQTPVPVLP